MQENSQSAPASDGRGDSIVIRTPLKFTTGIKYSTHIDYLQFTTPDAPPDALLSEEIRPVQFYKRGFASENGTRYYVGNPSSDRWLVIMAGKAMKHLRTEVDEIEHVEMLLDTDCNISRIDLAMDLKRVGEVETFIGVDMIASWFRDGLIRSKHVKNGGSGYVDVNQDGIDINTFYMGDIQKRGKRGIHRAYDKGLELGLEKYMVTRIEIEEKRKHAMRTAKALMRDSKTAVFRSRFDVDHPFWEAVMQEPPAERPPRGSAQEFDANESAEATARRWQWLVEKIAPCLGRELALDALDGKDGNYQAFNDAVQKAFNETMHAHYR